MTSQLTTGLSGSSASPSQHQAVPSFARLIILFGTIWAVIALVFLPLVMVMAYNWGWIHLFSVIWLIAPTVVLLTSLKYWYTQRRIGAVADVIVASGVAFVWLLVILIGILGDDLRLGFLPYLVVAAFLIFTILTFWAFTRSFSGDIAHEQPSKLSLIYWGLFLTTLAIVAVTYGLVLYFQIFGG